MARVVNHENIHFNKWRYFFVIAVLGLMVLSLLGRLIYLTVINRKFLLNQGDARTLRTISVPAYRGMITDRNGIPMAISTPVKSIWVDPSKFHVSDKELATISKILQLPFNNLKEQLAKYKDREFFYLKRRINPVTAESLQQLHIPGLYFQSEFRRYYPEGAVTAHVLGNTNIDDKGQEGLELAYDHWLSGTVGKKRVLKDRYGHIIAEVQNISAPHPGHTLVLSIDRRIQYLASEALKEAMQINQAVSGSVVVLDTKTGEVLAMVNEPTFNPNENIQHIDNKHRNRAITDVFEPGSTMKVFSIASALLSGKFHADTLIDTNPGWMKVDHNIVRDHHNNGVIDVTTVLQRSSNMGVAKMTLSLPGENLWSLLHHMGFGEITQCGFPGERGGSLNKDYFTRPFDLATLSFGYGISVTALQLAQAYSIIANQGIKKQVTFLRTDTPAAGEQVMDAEVSKQMLTMLQAVLVKGGTGYAARVPGYNVAGKTGTSHIAIHGGYAKNRYVASFVGIAPVTDPRLVVVVVIRDPHGKWYYATDVAAPAFSRVMAGALRILNIPPDNINNNLVAATTNNKQNGNE